MSSLSNYGHVIAATTVALQSMLAGSPFGLNVTARSLDVARSGVTGSSVNLFLYSDSLITYREASAQHGPSRVIAELRYLVSAFAADVADTDAASHRDFGTAQAAIERHPVLTVPVTANENLQVWLTPAPLTTDVLTALWQASGAPLRMSFAVMASFTLDTTERITKLGTVRDVVKLAGAGAIAVFSGADAAAKSQAAASAARELGTALVTVELGSVVGTSIEETVVTLDRLFDRAKEQGAVLLIDDADALFGVRPEELDPDDPYAAIDVGAVLDRLGNAPSVVIIGLAGLSGDELADRAGVEVRFPVD
jgi:hypothetical protein